MIRVRVPATTANLGPGFDCMGLALNLWNTFTLELGGAPGTVEVETRGEGSDSLPRDSSNLVAQTMMEETWPGMVPTDRGIRIRCENAVPAASGLGSSSTATLAGLLFASALAARAIHRDDPAAIVAAVREPQNLDRVLRRAIQLEGHGDNVAPALLGGLILVAGQTVRRLPFAPLRAVVCVPDFNFLTVDARAALPGEYSKSDVIHNIGHALLVADALRTGDWELLGRAVVDRVHEPYRFPRIPGAEAARDAAKVAGAQATWLSGAGPGILAVSRDGHEQIAAAMIAAFSAAGLPARAWVLEAVPQGTEVLDPDY